MSEPQALPGLPQLTLEREVPCRMSDGVTLFADVYRPVGDGPWPVILMRTPYERTQAASNVGYSHPSWYARHGYVVVVQDCRGRCGSEGTFVPFETEADDGYETIEWAARLKGSDGRVATYGFSYPGIAQLLAATRRPPSLVAIAPAFCGSQAYEGWTYNGGALALAFVSTWAAQLAIDTARRRGDDLRMAELIALLGSPDRMYWQLPLRELGPLLADGSPYFADWLAHDSYDDYWRRWSIDEDYSRIDVPALHVGGWYDVFARGTVKNFVGLGGKLVLGPWWHMPWAPIAGGGHDGAATVDDWHLRFFDHVLKGDRSDGWGAPVTAFVMGDGWRDFDAWPPSASYEAPWFLHSRGRANSATGDGTMSPQPPVDEPPDVYIYDPLTPTLSAGGHSCCWPGAVPMGPACQAAAEQWNGVLVYTSDPLKADLFLVGDVSVTLHAASSAASTDFTARLCVVGDDGRSTNLLEGITRSRRGSHAPGDIATYRIDLGPIGIRIPAGQRLRLDISSSDFPQWDRNLNAGGQSGGGGPSTAVTATQTVLHDRLRPSHVTLPVLVERD